MDWKEHYRKKRMSAEDAAKYIQSNQRVVIQHAAGEPVCLVEAMMANREQYENVEIFHMVPLGNSVYTHPGMEKHFRHNTTFAGRSTRKALDEKRADFTPCFFYQLPGLFEKIIPVDVAMIHVSPPDAHGFCSLGVSADYTWAAAKHAKLVMAQVNDQMPRTLGNCFIHVEEIDCIVEHSCPVIELLPPKIGIVEEDIGSHCAKLIHDGDTLQLGIGAIPDAVIRFLKDKKDLGIHSEMISDGVVDLVDAGIINNRKKTLHKNKSIVSFLMGTKKLYDFVNNNPSVEMYPVDYVNHPMVIMQNDNMVSINSCIQIDLMGQVVSETVGRRQISGVGGQVDFVRGASMSKGGRTIIAMPSTAAGGKISRIAATIDEGAAVTTSRNDVDYIVTEYGIAALKGRTLKERAQALIEIAHPDFREDLRRNM